MSFILAFIIILIDQFTKYLVIINLKGKTSYIIIKDFIRFTYVENYGAAFGILRYKRIFFVIVTLAVIVILLLFLIKYYGKLNLFMKVGTGLLLGGAIGNFIDRVRFGYVVDFISMKFLNKYEFAVFNIADTAIVVGTIIILFMILFDKQGG